VPEQEAHDAPEPKEQVTEVAVATAPQANLLDAYEFGEDESAAATSPAATAPEGDGQSRRERDDKGRFLPKPPATKHSPLLLKRAKDLGLSEEDLAEYSPSELKDHLRELAWDRMLERQAKILEERWQGPQPAVHGGPTGGQDVPPAAAPDTDLDVGLDPEQFTPEVIGAFKSLKKQNLDLQRRLEALEHGQQAQAQQTFEVRADRVFAKFPNIFGEGRGFELQGTPEYARRVAVIEQVQRMQKEPGSLEQKLSRAALILYPQLTERKPEPKRPGHSVDEWNDGALAKPTNRNTSEPPSEAKARKSVAKWFAENGVTQEAGVAGDEFI
jgi:hypothetical protein